MAVMAPYLIGVVTAPLVARVLRPAVRGIVKTTVAVALEVKRAAAEAGEQFHGIAAEVDTANTAKAAKSQVGRGAGSMSSPV